jgi:hypothetical protein
LNDIFSYLFLQKITMISKKEDWNDITGNWILTSQEIYFELTINPTEGTEKQINNLVLNIDVTLAYIHVHRIFLCFANGYYTEYMWKQL